MISSIKLGGAERERALAWFYKDARGDIIPCIKGRYRLNNEDFEMVYHDGLVALEKAILEDKFRGDCPLKFFLLTICKRKAFDLINFRKADADRRKSFEKNEQQEIEALISPEEEYIEKER